MGLALVGLVQPQLPYDFLVGQQFSVLRESDSGFWIDNVRLWQLSVSSTGTVDAAGINPQLSGGE